MNVISRTNAPENDAFSQGKAVEGREKQAEKPTTQPTTHSPDTLKLRPEQRVDEQRVDRKAPIPEDPIREDPRPETPIRETQRTSAQPLPGKQIEGDTGPILKPGRGGKPPVSSGGGNGGGGGGGDRGASPDFHKRANPDQFVEQLAKGMRVVRGNLGFVMVLTCATNLLVLAIPIYLFQISDRVLTSRSLDTLVMLTVLIVGAVVLQAIFDAVRRFILMRTAVEVAVRLGAPVLSAAAHASLQDNGRQYQTLGDLQQLRGFLTSGTLISFLDVPFAPIFIFAIFLVHPHLGMIVIVTALILMVVAIINQKATAKPFAEANIAQSRANMHLDSMSRNSQIINALAMVPEAVALWGRDTANSLQAQVRAQDRNIFWAAVSRASRLLTQIAMLGWGAYLAIQGEITGGMVIAASIIAGRALGPIEGSIEGWNGFLLSRSAYDRVRLLMHKSVQRFEKLRLPNPEGRLNVERLLYVPAGTKQVVLNGLSFSLTPGESLAVIGNSGAGKTTLGKMLVGSILPTSGNVRLDLMDLRNWDTRQLGENIGYLPQDVQLFPGSIKDNIARMRGDARDEDIHRAALLADVHDMIAQLPHGYETMVQADGSPLSGGQKQRIALARAFFGNPRFLVLDEPNSNLDTAGDRALANAIRHASENGITTVVITQKPSLLSVVDKIMLLADGNVALFGYRQQVLQQLAQRSQGGGNLPQSQNNSGGQPNV
ncbi:Type I secretion system ATP-binding protein PrsD [Phaeobacter sp. CECT 5382]|uniref:type I secretion system permease/ATPase n=1 Tax=Phaeobacter sp. CECT 5382 TaxID=1712645 RepID=UPI0006DB218C|nr:type I secretion system permease/ATPase [Phaeobacter sp. CECT 5382]CUH88078.1 Type I secretion system ATP-binding protein PrsD [Phaeobacter sp. CECT 5382]